MIWYKTRGFSHYRPLQTSTFPDGQPHVKVPFGDYQIGFSGSALTDLVIDMRDGATDIASLVLLRQFAGCFANITIFHLLGGRMDRPLSEKEPFTLKAVTDLINDLGARQVHLMTPHSMVSGALIKNSRSWETNLTGLVSTMIAGLTDGRRIYLVAPDLGAAKRVAEVEQDLAGYPIIQCTKHRDFGTGELSNPVVLDAPTLMEGAHLIVVDDLVDAGGTFLQLEPVLRSYSPASISLAVAHGLFTRGVDRLLDAYDRVGHVRCYTDEVPYVPQEREIVRNPFQVGI